MNQENLREKLIEVISKGLTAVAISKAVGMNASDLGRFKNGQINLIDYEAHKLDKYLSMVNIPTNVKC